MRSQLFESGAILSILGLQERAPAAVAISPADARRSPWPIAALNSVEPAILNLLLMINVFNKGEAWAEEAGPKFIERARRPQLKCMSDGLATRNGWKTASPSAT